MQLTAQQCSQYRDAGYVVVRRLFEPHTARQMIDHYMEARRKGPLPGDYGGTSDHPEDPTRHYPRMINMHDWDPLSEQWATAAKLQSTVRQLIDDEPVLRQTMIYFKPPLGRGQGLHQDAQYITIEPLIGVWIALDRSDEPVGQMTVVPGSHLLGLMPVEAADTAVSFTDVQIGAAGRCGNRRRDHGAGRCPVVRRQDDSRFLRQPHCRPLAAELHLPLRRETCRGVRTGTGQARVPFAATLKWPAVPVVRYASAAETTVTARPRAHSRGGAGSEQKEMKHVSSVHRELRPAAPG